MISPVREKANRGRAEDVEMLVFETFKKLILVMRESRPTPVVAECGPNGRCAFPKHHHHEGLPITGEE
jgi:hypothetical protein